MINKLDYQRLSASGVKFFQRSSLYVSIFVATSGLAVAQEVPGQDPVLEEVEVIEILGSTTKNLAIKRDSNSIVDAITSEDVGKFPDKNVADSLQRVPGRTITRSGSEGSRVSILGTSANWTLTQLNGSYISTSDSGYLTRSFNYALLPSATISRVEAYKSPKARLDEGGIGGTVILHSRKPLELDGDTVVTYGFGDNGLLNDANWGRAGRRLFQL